MNFDHDSDQINERERIHGVLYRREVAGGRVFSDVDSVRRKKLVFRRPENRVSETANEFDPFHKLLF